MTLAHHRAIPAKAGIQLGEPGHFFETLRHWTPASAGVERDGKGASTFATALPLPGRCSALWRESHSNAA